MNTASLTALEPRRRTAFLAIFAGLAASLVGIGLARFAYTPLIPPMVQEHWFPAGRVALLGAANLAGYLVGALSGRAMARFTSPVAVLRQMMALTSVAFFACAFPLSEVWFFVWRLASGVAGGAIMVLVTGVVLHHVPAERRGFASGAVFVGVGLGVVLSGTLVPLMLAQSLRATWLMLGAVSLVLTLLAWFAWPPAVPHDRPQALATLKRTRTPAALRILLWQYALMAVGLVPEMMFLVDYLSRGLSLGYAWGAAGWVAYGAGAMVGPLLYGLAADRFGARRAVRYTLGLQALAVVAFSVISVPVALLALAVLIGSFPPGIPALALGRLDELVHDTHTRQAMWSRATVFFALTQAVSGYAYSAVYALTGGHHQALFAISAVALAAAVALDVRRAPAAAATV